MVAALRRSLVLALVVLGWMGLVARVGFGLVGGEMGLSECQSSQHVPALETDTAKNNERPLPDIPALMHSVETNQRISEAIEKDYLYRSVQTQQELNGHGAVKKTETKEYEIFWVDGVPVHRLLKKDGKELSAEEQQKESEKIDKEAARGKERRAKAEGKGAETDPHGNEMVTVSRLLELGSFTNARRVQLNGRDTIAIDFTGDPKAKTKNRFEDVIRDLVGTAWIDEQDRMLVKGEGHFVNTFKIGGGLVANIQKGTSFSMEQRKVNNEVWLPAKVEGQGSARALLFFSFNGRVQAVESGYRKFKATSTILPGISRVEDGAVAPQ